MKPFNPDFIPAVGDIDAFLKVRHQIIDGLWIQTFWSLANLLIENEYSLIACIRISYTREEFLFMVV